MEVRYKNILLKVLVEISRILLGVTFIFSGFVKSIDPWGTAYKVQDYMTSFGFEQFHGLALAISVFQCAGELFLGLLMLLGMYRKWTSRLIFLVMLFMTPLTLYLAIANPVKDCGCFGDALIITNWETFFKNIVLMACAVIVLIWNQKITNLFTGKFYWFVGIYMAIYSVGFCLYNYFNEPIIDFRPYKIGANIPQLMTVDPAKSSVYENIYIYKKDGLEKEFTEDNYPWEDSTWVFVDRTTKIVKQGEDAPIQDFSIKRLYLNLDRTEVVGEEDITQEVLSDSIYTFLMVSHSLTDIDTQYLSRFEDINNYANDYGYKFLCLTASPSNVILQQEKEDLTNFDFCQSGDRTLKTMIRSNPGLFLLKNGIIINKWQGKDIVDESQLNKPIEELSISVMPDTEADSKTKLWLFILALIAPLVVIKILDGVLYHRKANPQKTNKTTI